MALFSFLRTNYYRCAQFAKKIFSNEAMNPSMLQEHLTKLHTDKKDKNVSYFQVLEEKYFKPPTVSQLFASSTKQDNDGLKASYISLLIAKAGKPHNWRGMWHITCRRLFLLLGNLTRGIFRPRPTANVCEKTRDHLVDVHFVSSKFPIFLYI
jgi:hypothetical protein